MVKKYYNAKLLLEKGIQDGCLVVKDNQIVFIGQDYIGADEEYDVKGNLLMPTFKNAHAHSPMTFLRSNADDMPLQEWLEKQIFPYEAKLTEDDVYFLTKLAILEYLSSGIGAVSDMYFINKPIAKACNEYGFRNSILNGIVKSDINKGIFKILDDEKEYIESLGEFVKYNVGIHAEYSNSLESLKEVSRYIHKYKLPIFAHMSETKKEVEDCIKIYNKTPVELFNELGLFDFGGTVYHMVYPKENDLKILKERNINVVTCPASNLKLASGIANIKKMLDLGINVAIGTDGPASNNSLDMFKEMYLAYALQKVLLNQAQAIEAKDILKMALCNGSKAMGLEKLDGLKVGNYADFIEVDLNMPNMQPENNIINNLVYSCGKQNIKMTVINGKELYKDGKYFIKDSKEEIYKKANQIALRIKEEVNG